MNAHRRPTIPFRMAAVCLATAGFSHGFAQTSPVGVLGNGAHTVALTRQETKGGHFIQGSSVFEQSDGNWRYVPGGGTAAVTVPAGDPGALAQVEESRGWLKAGIIPGGSIAMTSLAERALLDLRLLQRPNGAIAAAQQDYWAYNWPRDTAFAVAALAATGHALEGYRSLVFTASTQKPDGTWDARTLLDGPRTPDGRHFQLDANGWFPWSVWFWGQTSTLPGRRKMLEALYPVVRKAADAASGLLGSDGLPPASPDYWEVDTETRSNLGTAAPWLTGLRAAADLAHELGHPKDEAAWTAAARRLDAAISTTFGRTGYSRTPDGGTWDSAVAFLGRPFNHPSPQEREAIRQTFQKLVQPNGFVVPGLDSRLLPEGWSSTWTPSTLFFALAWSAQPETRERSRDLVRLLSEHLSPVGSIPEQITFAGAAASVAPLGWTDALVLMTLLQLDGKPLPIPPAR
jgi:glucoamylase